jgi:D-glycero-D-manno-heptose 1,7-bisphosphate phosphatase
MTTLAPAVFLDRDGTLIEEAGYLDDVDRMQLFPFTVDALRLIGRAGYRRVVVTNQSGIALGLFDAPFVEQTHRTLDARLREGGAGIEGWYYCPHRPDRRGEDGGNARSNAADTEVIAAVIAGAKAPALQAARQREVQERASQVMPGCGCRKPEPGMLHQAAADLGIDLTRSWAIGDRWTDVQLAATAGLRGGILLRTGHGVSAERRPVPGCTASRVANDLLDAVSWILRQDRQPGTWPAVAHASDVSAVHQADCGL